MGLFFLSLLAVLSFLFPHWFRLSPLFVSNFILLLFAFLYSVCSHRIGVGWFKIGSGIKVTGDPLPMTLIGLLLTNAVVVKNGCPSLVICFVELTVPVMRCILFGDHSSSFALVASDSG